MADTNELKKSNNINNEKTDELYEEVLSLLDRKDYIAAHECCDNILKSDPQNYKPWAAKIYIAAFAFHDAETDLNSVENHVFGKMAWDTDGEYPTMQKIIYYADKAFSVADDTGKDEILAILYTLLCAASSEGFLRSIISEHFIAYHNLILEFINEKYDYTKTSEHFEKYIKCLFDLADKAYDFEAEEIIILLFRICKSTNDKLVNVFNDEIELNLNKLLVKQLRSMVEETTEIQNKILAGSLSYVSEYNKKREELIKTRKIPTSIPDDLSKDIDAIEKFNTDELLIEYHVKKLQECKDAFLNNYGLIKNKIDDFNKAKEELSAVYNPSLKLSSDLKRSVEDLLSIDINKYSKSANRTSNLTNNIIGVAFAIFILGLVIFLTKLC